MHHAVQTKLNSKLQGRNLETHYRSVQCEVYKANRQDKTNYRGPCCADTLRGVDRGGVTRVRAGSGDPGAPLLVKS